MNIDFIIQYKEANNIVAYGYIEKDILSVEKTSIVITHNKLLDIINDDKYSFFETNTDKVPLMYINLYNIKDVSENSYEKIEKTNVSFNSGRELSMYNKNINDIKSAMRSTLNILQECIKQNTYKPNIKDLEDGIYSVVV